MTADPQPVDPPDRNARDLRDALFASDLKRLVRASADDDDSQVCRIRESYLAE